jgi:hypothetical protein
MKFFSRRQPVPLPDLGQAYRDYSGVSENLHALILARGEIKEALAAQLEAKAVLEQVLQTESLREQQLLEAAVKAAHANRARSSEQDRTQTLGLLAQAAEVRAYLTKIKEQYERMQSVLDSLAYR